MKSILTFTFFFSILLSAFSQVSFDSKHPLFLDSTTYKTRVNAVADFNGDGFDDIAILALSSRNLTIFYQNESNESFTKKTLNSFGSEFQFAICAADLNRNGSLEILAGGVYEFVEIIASENLDGDSSYHQILPQSEDVFVQGTNIVDINNDGHLDIFMCHDDGANYIWENDGQGNFAINTDWIDFSINGSSGEPASGNYGSVWTDIDMDGDLDLYIAKCRALVTDVTDSRRINRLYVNDGNGNFSEDAQSAGLDLGWQSWTADFQDINNDGYQDALITNHDYKSQIFLNDGTGYFSELENTGVESIDSKVVQAIMLDFNNDGWIDILTAGQYAQFFINNQDNTFTELPDAIGENFIRSFAVGDLNNDGLLEFYGANRFGGDNLWFNTGESDNNYLDVNLKGIFSNINGIGARIEIYGDWGIQVREVRAGESWGIMNTLTQHFGLGQAQVVDSLIIRWPSGIVQKEYNIEINSKTTFVEKCFFDAPELNFKTDTTLCNGDSLILEVEGLFETYNWNNGSTSSELIVKNQGTYEVTVYNEIGCQSTSSSLNLDVDSPLSPQIGIIGSDSLCLGMSSALINTSSVNAGSQIWSTGDVQDTLIVNEPGTYFLTQENVCGEFTSNEIEIFVDTPLTPEIELIGPDSLCAGMDALIVNTSIENVENQMWSTDDILDTLLVIESGTYFFIQENICDQYTSNEINITVFDFPDAPTTSGDSIIKGATALISASGENIRWYDDPMDIMVIGFGNELSIDGLEETSVFYASASSGNDLCEGNRSAATVVVEEEVSVEDRITSNIQIYPNPANHFLHIDLANNKLPAKLEIYSITSNLILSRQLNSTSEKIDMSKFSEGLYVIKIEYENEIFTSKLILH